MSKQGHISWIPASEFTQSWLPAHFTPKFVALERYLGEHRGAYVRLGDLVDIASMWPPGDAQVDWLVVRKGEQLVIEAADRATNQLVLLPDECLVLHPLVFRGLVATTYWSARLMSGRGATSPTSYALVSRQQDDVAWLDEA